MIKNEIVFLSEMRRGYNRGIMEGYDLLFSSFPVSKYLPRSIVFLFFTDHNIKKNIYLFLQSI